MKAMRLTLVIAAASAGLALPRADAQPRDPATLAPADALLCAGWTKLNDGHWELLKAFDALLRTPKIAEEMEVDAEMGPPLMTVIDGVTRATTAFVLLPDDGARRPLWSRIGAVVAAGEQSAALREAFDTLIRKSDPPPITAETIAGVEFQAVQDRDFPLRWAEHNGHLILALSETAAGALIARAQGSGESLAETDRYRADLAKIGGLAGDWCFTLYGDVPALLKLLPSEVAGGGADARPDALLTGLGVDAMTSYMLRADRVAYGPRLGAFARLVGERRGLMRLYAGKPLSDDRLQIVPQDAYWASVFALNLTEVYRELRGVFEALDPKMIAAFDELLVEARQELGFSIIDDLLPVLGDTWALYDAPSHGGLLITGMVLAVEVKDAARLQALLAQVVQRLAREFAGEGVALQLRETQRGEHAIHYVVAGGAPFPIAPAWAFAESRWVLGLYPQTVAAALAQIDPQTRGPSLLDNADFQAARAELPAEFSTLSYADARGIHRLFYAVLQLGRAVVASLTAEGPAAFDLGAVPLYADEVAGIRPMVLCSAPDADGLLYSGVGVRPLAFLTMGDSGGATTGALAISILLPALTRAREMAKRAVCTSNLRGIGQGCHIYANDHREKFPPDLAALVTEGMATPMTFICPSSGQTEGEAKAALAGGPGRLSYMYIAGQDASGDPRNVLVYEDLANHAGEGGNVLFADGSVRFLTDEAFRAAIRETYQRLNRAAELPAEFKP